MKITKLVGILVLVGSLALAGCARIALYDNPKLEGPEVGVKYYYSKPYLLVARTGAKDNPVQISVIYLPDQSKEVYAKLKTGFGSANLSLAFTNSILTSIGQETDTKIPETITALASMATAAKGLVPQAAPSYQPISTKLQSIADGLYTLMKEAKDLTNPERQQGSSAVALIQQASKLLAAPEPNLAIAISYLKQAIEKLKPMTDQTPTRITIQRYCTELQAIIDSLSPKPAELPVFELYEIDNSSGKTELKKVEGVRF